MKYTADSEELTSIIPGVEVEIILTLLILCKYKQWTFSQGKITFLLNYWTFFDNLYKM